MLDLRASKAGASRRTLIVLNEGESPESVPAWATPVFRDDAVVVLAPRGVGPTAWVRKSPPNYIERAHVLLGRTVDEGRVWDVAATTRMLLAESGEKHTWRLAGTKQAGIIAAYAALFEPTVSEVVLVDPPVSHHEGPFFLNILQVLDIPEALGLLAPRPLALIGAKDDRFQTTKSLYNRAGAESKLNVK
jgi:hypothetical protein